MIYLKADRALSKLNFHFYLKLPNLVTLWKCNSHLQYYKIDFSVVQFDQNTVKIQNKQINERN